MALNIQPPNLSGLAALSSGGGGNLNLGNAGALGLQALELGQRRDTQIQQAALERARLQQQGQQQMAQQGLLGQQLALQAQQQQRQGLLDQGNLAMRQREFGAAGVQNATENEYKKQLLAQQGALGQGQLDADKQKLAQEALKMEMARLVDMNKDEIQKRGAYAAYAVTAMKSAKTPEEAHMIREEILKEATNNKYISKEMSAQVRKMPISQATNLFMYEAAKYDQVGNMQKMLDANKEEKKGSEGTSEIILPDGTVVKSSSPSSAVKTDVMKRVISSESLQKNFDTIEKGYDPNYFRYGNKIDAYVSKEADKLKDTPLGGIADVTASTLTGMTPKQRDAFVTKRTTFMNNVDQVFNQYRKDITGAAAALAELDRLQSSFLSGEMSPAEFRGALDLVKSKGLAELEQNKQVLNAGIDTAPSKVSSHVRDRMIADGHSAEEVDAFLAKKKGQ